VRRKILNPTLFFSLAGLVFGALAGPAWALAGALAGLLFWVALKKGAGLLLLKALRSPAAWLALLGSIAGALAVGPLWALAGAAGGVVAWLVLIELREKLRGEG
jgi:hypothetical protein